MNYQNSIHEEQLMVEQLAALNHLPPGFSLPLPESKVAAELVTSLRLISEMQNPFTWLQNERGAFCAWLTLTLCLKLGERIRLSRERFIDTHQRWSAAQTTTSTGLESMQNNLFGNLLEAAKAWPSYELWDDTLVEPYQQDQLRLTLQDMQRQAALPSNPHPPFSVQNRRDVFVLCDLLRLPMTTDPLSWLLEERRDIIAYITLASLLDYILPSSRMIIANPPTDLLSSSPMLLHAGNSFEVKLQRVENRQLGFTIDLDVRYIIPKQQRSFLSHQSAEEPDRFLRWEGFEHIVDTNGHFYISQIITHRTQTIDNKRCQGNLTLVCWPPLTEPTELLLQTRPVVLALYEAPVFMVEGRLIHTQSTVPRPSVPIDTELQAHVIIYPT